LDRKQLM